MAIPEHWEGYRQNILATLAEADPAIQIVAEGDAGIIGAVLLYPAGTDLKNPGGRGATLTWPEVRLLAVTPASRGHGVAAALMQACIRRARESKSTVLTLHTTDLMRAAVRLYERLGFARAPELDLEPAPGIIAKGYRLDLA